MKIRKLFKSFLLGAAGFLLVILLVVVMLLLFKPEVVHAVQDIMHLANLLYRFDDEILMPTEFGRYYSALYWKHNAELIRIIGAKEAYYWELIRVTLLFTPHLEMTLDGRGDEVRFTREQINELKSLLEWVKSRASDEFRGDIERESKRLPLDDFVGLTMNEALDYVERAYHRDHPAAPTPVPTLPPTTLPTYQPTGSPVP